MASAAPDAPADKEPLQTVVVVGTTPLPGAEADASKIPAPVQNATSADIERTHATDVSAFMNRALGSVYVNDVQNNPLQPDINYRGYAASPLLGTPQGLSVYVDGVRMNQPFGDVVSWDLIPRASIASLTLMPGSNPVFGLNTLGGALAIRTRDGFSDPGTSLEATYGSHAQRSGEISTGGNTAGGFHWFASANKFADDGWRDASPTDALQTFAKFGWRGPTTDIALTGAYAKTDLTGNGLQEQRFLDRDFESVYTKPDNTQNDAVLFNLVAKHAFSDVLTLSANAYYRNISTQTLNGDLNDDSLGEDVYQPTPAEQAALADAGYTGFPTNGENAGNTPFPSWRCIANILLNTAPNEKCTGLLSRTDLSQHETGIAGQLTFREELAGHANQLTAGVAYARSGAHFLQASQFGYLTPDRGVDTADGPGAFADGTQDSEGAYDARVDLTGTSTAKSVYATDTFAITAGFNVTISGRYDRTIVEGRDALTPAGDLGSLSGNHDFSRFNPSAGLTFDLSPAVSLYAGYTEGSRAPSAIELGCADPENPCRLPNSMAGDPPLDQVVTKTIEAGLRGRARHLVWNVGVFNADNHDDIMFVADNVAGFGYFKNFGETRRRGVEAGATAELSAFTVGAHYTSLDATYRSAEVVIGNGNSSNDADAPGFEGVIGVSPGDRIPLTPQYIFKAFTNWKIVSNLTLNLDMLLIGDSFARGNENNRHEPDGVYYLGSGKIGGYTAFNLGLDYTPIERLRIFVEVDNLLDRHYYTSALLGATGFDGAGNFVARPFAGPIIDGERPLQYATFYGPCAIRSFTIGAKYRF
jgi:outer membrane receptor protein involved in Fe transport